jgi:ABC-type multidrug transport system ATPase subunit
MAKAEVVTAAPVVRAQGFTKRYRSALAVDTLDLEVRRGEIFGLIGPDGAGKSSLMKAVAGVLSFDAGTLEVFGISLDSERACEKIKDRIGLMPQGLGQNLYPDLSIEENIDFFARLRLVPEQDLAARKDELLAATRLDTFRDRPMKKLSGGMKQKLGLVCTLIHAPELIILDEPTTGVDPVSRRDFWAILEHLLAMRGITALVSTAYMDEAARFNRVALMFGGKLLASGNPDDMAQLAPGHLVTAQADSAAIAAVRQSFAQVDVSGSLVRVFVDDGDSDAALTAVAGVLPAALAPTATVSDPELEDTFVALLRRRGLAQTAAAPATAAVTATIDNRVAQIGAHVQATAIEAVALTRDFGNFRAVDKVSFQVPPGEIFGLLGANGAGKSTVIKMLTGITRPSDGQGKVAGVDMRGAGFAIKERIGYMSQAFSLYLDLSVVENIRLYAGIYGLDRRTTAQRLGWVLDMAGLQDFQQMRADALPMGLRQRLALGCALVHRPQVLFLDEPTSGVDPIGRRAFWETLFRLSREDRVAILVTTHYMSEAEHCDHLALMYAGRVVADDSPAGMKAAVELEAGKLLEISASDPRECIAALTAGGYPGASLFGKKLHLFSHAPDADRLRVATVLAQAGMTGVDVRARVLSMEDVFVYRVTALEAAALAEKRKAA